MRASRCKSGLSAYGSHRDMLCKWISVLMSDPVSNTHPLHAHQPVSDLYPGFRGAM